MSSNVPRTMGNYAGLIYSKITELNESPFNLDEDSIEKTLQIAKNVHKKFLDMAEMVAEKHKVKLEDAENLLISGKTQLLEFDDSFSLPTIFDIAASPFIRPWILFVDDEEEELNEVRSIFKEKEIGVKTIKDEKEFLEQAKIKPYLQYWVDLGLGGGEGKIDIGLDVFKQLKRLNRPNGKDIIIYTHHSKGKHISKLKSDPSLMEIINKTDKKAKERIRSYSSTALDVLEKIYHSRPKNHLIELAAAALKFLPI